ncbi:MAG: GNAT family N-acetyltransferase [Sphingomonadaceae bacterium]
MTLSGLTIIDYHKGLAQAFHDINVQWIENMFVVEAHDAHVLSHPDEMIIEPGGAILFVASPDQGILGTGALMKSAEGEFELTKMGVLETARGLKAGEFLLRHLIERARLMTVKKLYLLTNHKCAAAIHLYEKLGFVHSEAIMRDYGHSYDRCDVAMEFPL